MLTDKDFDGIGKRLYDLEADPPEKGWDKIASDLNPTPGDPEKGGFLKRNWWKPLVLLIPVSFYLMWPSDQKGNGASMISALQTLSDSSNASRSLSEEVVSTGEKENLTDLGTRTEETQPDQPFASSNRKKTDLSSAEPERKQREPFKKSAIASRKEFNEVSSKNENDVTDAIPRAGSVRTNAESGWEERDGERQDDIGNETASHYNHQSDLLTAQKKESPVVSAQLDSVRTDDLFSKDDQSLLNASGVDKKQDNPKDAMLVAKDDHPTVADGDEDDQMTKEDNGNTVVSSEPLGTPQKNATIASPKLAEVISHNPGVVPVVADSSQLTKKELPDSIEGPATDEDSENDHTRISSWRLTVGFAPQFLYNSARPVSNDEVLVTSIRDRKSNYPERIGFGLALGAGKAVNKNLYVDGQLTFTKMNQNILYSYATGKVDTLIATQRSDGNIMVSPVYQLNDTEKRAEFSYAGLRIGGTYYFWSTPVRRFSFTASAGANFLISNSMKEKIEGNWISQGNGSMNKINYSLMIGVGYNIDLNNGWEVMFSPMFNYFLRKIETEQQPFNLSHRSYGLNITLSKSLGKIQ